MKKILPLFICLLLSYHAFAQNVGVGTASPVARLHVADSSVLFGAAGDVNFISPGNPPISGAGRRMMWYPDKAAFRIGYVDGNQWDKSNIGFYSFATGSGNMANGGFSTAMGGGTTASGAYSTTSNYMTTASGFGSTAFGFRTTAKAHGSIALGTLNDDTDTPDGFNPAANDRIFQLGNGDMNTFIKSNALTVLRNGYIGMGTLLPQAPLHLKSNYINPVIIDGGDAMYVTLAENGIYKGYIGSYYGNPDDVDFGTYAGSSGAVHLTTNNSTPRLTVLQNGNVGVGTTVPLATLHVARGSSPGGTAMFSGTTHISYFNYSTNEDTYIRPGKDNGYVIINDIPNGRVGVGVNNPSFKLDVGDRMRIRTGASGSAGLYLNNSTNLAQPAFIGMEDDTHVGLYGNVSGWKFSMNTQTGALKINNSEGSAGQVLQSNGASAPSWGNPLTALYDNMTEYSQSAVVNMNNPGPGSAYSIPGLTSITLVITSVSKVIFSGGVRVQRSACGGCGSISQFFQLSIASPFTSLAESAIFLSPLESAILPTGMRFHTLGPGTYTINATIFNGSGGTGTATEGWLNIIVVPQ